MRGAGATSKNRRRAPALLIAMTLLANGCTIGPSTRPPLATFGGPAPAGAPQSTSDPIPTGAGGPGRTSDPIVWSNCPAAIARVDPVGGRTFTLQCGQVLVPKLYSAAGSGSGADNGSGTFYVSVVKATAAGTPVGAAPLVVVLDDPGQHGTQAIAQVAGSLPAQILAHFSIVSTDLRGTGNSAAISCLTAGDSAALLAPGADPTTPVAAQLLAQVAHSVTFDCSDVVGPDLSDYSTVLAADDLDTVRAALGVPRVDFLGRGFGATLGAVYADRYPGRIGAAVLDGPADPSLPSDQQAAAAAAAEQRALVSFADACQTDPGGCALGADPVASVTALISKLGDAGAASTDGQRITGGSILLVLTEQLGNPAGWPALAAALASAGSGRYDAISTLLSAAAGTDGLAQQQAADLIYRCNDSEQRLGPADLTAAVPAARKAAPLFGPFLLGQAGLCADWPATQTALGPVAASGAPPILVLGGVNDPLSPYSEVRSLTAALTSATLLSWESGTHGAYPTSSCVTTAVDAYLLTGAVPADGTLCPP